MPTSSCRCNEAGENPGPGHLLLPPVYCFLSLHSRQWCFKASFGKLESWPLSVETVFISLLPTKDQRDRGQMRAGAGAGAKDSWRCWAGIHLSREGGRVALGRFLRVSPWPPCCLVSGLHRGRAVRACWAALARSCCARYRWWTLPRVVDSGFAWHVGVLSNCKCWSDSFQMCQSISKCHQSRCAQGTFCATVQYPRNDWARLSPPIQRWPFTWFFRVDLGDSIWPRRSSSDSSPAGTELRLGCLCIVCYLKFTWKATEICIIQYYLPERICPFYLNAKLFSKSILRYYWFQVGYNSKYLFFNLLKIMLNGM